LSEVSDLPTVGGGRREAPGGGTRVYRRPMAAGWWTRRANYFWYIVREFTALPMALWLLWFLVEIKRAQDGPKGYFPHSSTGFVIFSVIVLLFSLYHSVTFLSLAGVILHFRVLDRPVPSRLIVMSQFGLWLVASAVIAFVLVYFGR
jgi:fumarate reductase subunit C